QKEEERSRVQMVRQLLADDREGVACRARVLMDIDAEERPGDDVEAETFHLLVDVDGSLPARGTLPILQKGTRPLDHERGEGCDAAPLECRLHEAPLSQPEFPVARDEAFAEKALHYPVVEALRAVDRVTILEHVLDVVRLPDDHD